jgi:YegS/Rv2252/BmrU family lipid kinase
MTWTVIVNPNAGSRARGFEEIRTSFRDRAIDAEIHRTTTVADVHDVVQDALDDGVRRFVAVGGDGTVHHLVDALMANPPGDGRITFAVVPTGSGSDFIRTFGRARDDADSSLDRLASPELYPVDVGVVTGSFGTRHFINALNAGIAAASVERATRLPSRLGSLKYTAAFWLALAGFPEADVDVSIGRHRFDGSAINVVVANGQYFGGGLNVAPRATLVDGELDVQVFSGPKRNAFVIMPRLALGSHLTHRAVRRYVGGEVTITCPVEWPVEADGELLGSGPVTVSVVPGALDFVV